MRLVDGAEAIRGDLPSAATVTVEVPLGTGNDQETRVQRLSSLVQVKESTRAALEGLDTVPVIVGGDCGVELAAIDRASAANDAMAVVWIDAHPDVHTAESSPSGAFHGMVLRTLLGDGLPELLPERPLEPSRVVLAGMRAPEDDEVEFIRSSGLAVLAPEQLSVASVTAALEASGATSVYLHVDLDVLDPAEISGVGYPEPFGVTLATLLEVIAAAKEALPLVGAGITEFAPASPEAAGDDLGTILRIVGAITA
jgi:arginase